MALITAPGIYPDITPEQYFAEPCPAPALTNSGIGLLVGSCPAKFAHAHPMLGNATERPATDAMRRGSLVHRLALGKGAEFAVSPYDDYRTKEAREWRDAQSAAGVTPIKAAEYDEAEAIASVMRGRISEAVGGEPYQTEVVIAWQWRDVWCRAMLDVWCPTEMLALDIKTCRSADDEAIQRVFGRSYGRQEAWYRHGIEQVTGLHGQVEFAFLFVETEPPYLSRPVATAEAMRHGSLAECDRALSLFERCLETGDWPGYAPVKVQPTSWQVRGWAEAELQEAA